MTDVSLNNSLFVSQAQAQMPPRDVDPDTYANTYATENGITLDEAKAKLKEKYGDPKAPESESIFSEIKNGRTESSEEIVADSLDASMRTGFMNFIHNLFGLNDDAESKDELDLAPDKVAEKYAEVYGVSLDEAKEILFNTFGTPDEPEKGVEIDSETSMPPVDPDAYAQRYAFANGLTLEEAKAKLKELYGEPKQ